MSLTIRPGDTVRLRSGLVRVVEGVRRAATRSQGRSPVERALQVRVRTQGALPSWVRADNVELVERGPGFYQRRRGRI